MDEQNPPSADAPPENVSPAPKTGLSREEDIQRAAEMGRKRMESEAAIRARLKARKEEEARKGQEVALHAEERREELHGKKKEYRREIKERQKQAEEERKRREKEQQMEKEKAGKRAEEKKNREGYMQELREVAALKQAIENRKYKLKLEYEGACKRAHFDRQQVVEQAEFKRHSLEQELEREMRAKSATVEAETHQKLFQLESWRRMRLAAIDSEARSQQASLRGRSIYEIEKQRTNITATSNVKRKRAETEFKERKQGIENEGRMKSAKVAEELNECRTKGEMECKQRVLEADRKLARTLEELDYSYDAKLHGKKG